MLVAHDSDARLLVGVISNDASYTAATYQAFIAQQSYGAYEISYRRLGSNWFVLSGEGNGKTFYEKVMFSCGGRFINSFAMVYPTAERNIFVPIIEHIEDTFRPGTSCEQRVGREKTAQRLQTDRRIDRQSGNRRHYAGRRSELADRIARQRGQNVIVILRRRGPPYDTKCSVDTYRDNDEESFTWHSSADPNRGRAVGAMVLIVACGALSFWACRMSTSFWPRIVQPVTATLSQPATHPQITERSTKIPPRAEGRKQSAPRQSRNEPSASQPTSAAVLLNPSASDAAPRNEAKVKPVSNRLAESVPQQATGSRYRVTPPRNDAPSSSASYRDLRQYMLQQSLGK